MPTEREREYYRMGFKDGFATIQKGEPVEWGDLPKLRKEVSGIRKRKLSAWNKFVKANSNKKKFQYANGKLKLKKMGIAYRKKKR